MYKSKTACFINEIMYFVFCLKLTSITIIIIFFFRSILFLISESILVGSYKTLKFNYVVQGLFIQTNVVAGS